MASTLGIGIVGYGKVASRTHRRWIEQRPDAEIVAVCDTTEVRRKAALEDLSGGISVVPTYGELLENRDVDLIIITTPPNSHCDLAVAACYAGKHVLVDKPFAMTPVETNMMLTTAEEQGVIIHCHQSRRYDGEYRAILRLVQSGQIGDIVHVRRVWSQYGEGWANWGIEGFNPSWRIQREFGGGMVYDYAPHCGDQLLRLIDKPLECVVSDVRAVKFSTEVDDHFSCFLKFEGGATAYLEASNMARLPAPHWYVTGTKGCITAEGVGGRITLQTDADEEPRMVDPIEERDLLYDNLIQSCLGKSKPNVTPQELRDSTALIDAIFRSANTGTAVEF